MLSSNEIVGGIIGLIVTSSVTGAAFLFRHWLKEHLAFMQEFMMSTRAAQQQFMQEIMSSMREMKETLARDCIQRDSQLERTRLMSAANDMLVEEVGSLRNDLAEIEKRVDALEDAERTRAAARMCK